MRKYIASLALGTVIGIGVVLGSGVVSAEKPTFDGSPHRHFTMVNGEKVYIGPDFCDMDTTAQGFASFHNKVHLKFIQPGGPIQVSGEACPPED